MGPGPSAARDLGLSPGQVILAAMVELHVGPGEQIIKEGDHGDNFYVVDCGELEVCEAVPLVRELACFLRLQRLVCLALRPGGVHAALKPPTPSVHCINYRV